MFDRIPSVDALVNADALAAWRSRIPRPLVVHAARAVLQELRDAIAHDRLDGHGFEIDLLARRVGERLEEAERPPLRRTINATGIILHTGLGRAPLATEAAAALQDVAGSYAALELDLETGERGRRTDAVRALLCELTGADGAAVVNNNAAATMLVLAAIARGREVIVSRGELIEIGGSFRLPDVMSAGGAILREVGTTNRTRRSDYAGAIGDATAALMKVHTSNYRIEGFTEAVEIAPLVELGRRHGLPVIHDIGSGLLHAMAEPTLADEPDARSSIAAGADLVLFSGDKLLGGPQCGIIVGHSDWIARIESNPLARALRVDKLTLAALAATLQLHRDPQLARARLPIYQMLDAPLEQLQARARTILQQLRDVPELAEVSATPSASYLGGGTMPAKQIPSIAICLKPRGIGEHELARRLRTGSPAIVSRVQHGAVWLDLRTVLPAHDRELVAPLRRACGCG